MKKTEQSLKRVAILAAILTPLEPVLSDADWRYTYRYTATPETESTLAQYDAGKILNVSHRAVMDAYTRLLHEVRSLRSGGAK